MKLNQGALSACPLWCERVERGPRHPVGTHAATVWSVRQERCEVTSQVTSRCWATCWLKQTACDAKKIKSCGALCSSLPRVIAENRLHLSRAWSLTHGDKAEAISFFLSFVTNVMNVSVETKGSVMMPRMNETVEDCRCRWRRVVFIFSLCKGGGWVGTNAQICRHPADICTDARIRRPLLHKLILYLLCSE